MRIQLEEILSNHTGQDGRIHNDTDRDFVMTAAEAKEYGIIDEVIRPGTLADNTGPITGPARTAPREARGRTTWRSSGTGESC